MILCSSAEQLTCKWLFLLTVIGNLFLFFRAPLPHRMLHNLAEKYGDLMYLRLGFTPCIVVSSPALADYIHKNHDTEFSSRPDGLITGILNGDSQSVSMAKHGDLWKTLRSICWQILRPANIARYETRRMEEINIMLQSIQIAAEAGETVDLSSMLYKLSSNSMTQMLINRRYFTAGGNEENLREAVIFKKMISERLKIASQFAIGDYIPYLRFIDYLFRYNAKAQEIQSMTMRVCDEIMNLEERRRRLTREENGDAQAVREEDFVDDLLSIQAEYTADNSRKIKLTDHQIKLLVQDMLVAGTETSATTVDWAMAELLCHPKVLQQLRSEIVTVVGSRSAVTEQDTKQMPYLNAVVMETLRLHPAAPLNLPRESKGACLFLGRYQLPAKTRVIFNTHSIHRSLEAYDSPNAFKPERFLGVPQANVSGSSFFQLSPFGFGKRVCPGQALGTISVCAALANLVHRFAWSLPCGLPPSHLDMIESFGLTAPRRCPLILLPTPRLKV
uniref:Cytochrome P450 n=1 Tax=Physcomitrium patens TaxID=3218 RepID=A0A7I4AYV3_PHYPA